jgi:hypothetical protein
VLSLRSFLRFGVVLATTLTVGACAEHRIPHPAPDESKPHITWEIRAGGDTGEQDFVCGSAQPERPCALNTRTGDRPTSTAVHLFLHAAASDTSYLGVVSAPFLEESISEREVSITVPRGSRPVSSLVVGRVSVKPGAYMFRITLDATAAGLSSPIRIHEQVPVAVKGKASGVENSARR